MVWMARPAARLYARPPRPAPEAAIPLEKLRLVENHLGRMEVAVR